MSADKQQESSNRPKRVVGRPFPKGVSGNPGGKAPGTVSIKTAIHRYLREHPEKVDEIAAAIVQHTLDGSAGHLRELLERVDGIETQKVEHSGELHVREVEIVKGGG